MGKATPLQSSTERLAQASKGYEPEICGSDVGPEPEEGIASNPAMGKLANEVMLNVRWEGHICLGEDPQIKCIGS